MKKIIIVILVIIIIYIGAKFLFIDSNKKVQIDMQNLAEELINAQIFEDSLSKIDQETIIKKYGFNSEKIKNINSYVGTGATVKSRLYKGLKELKKMIKNEQKGW